MIILYYNHDRKEKILNELIEFINLRSRTKTYVQCIGLSLCVRTRVHQKRLYNRIHNLLIVCFKIVHLIIISILQLINR